MGKMTDVAALEVYGKGDHHLVEWVETEIAHTNLRLLNLQNLLRGISPASETRTFVDAYGGICSF